MRTRRRCRRHAIATFDSLQAEQLHWLAQADGLDLARLRLASPFNQKVKYNLYSALSILPRHQHRHLWQAEEAVTALNR